MVEAEGRKVLFVCRANVARSRVAKVVAQSMAQQRNLDLVVSSAGLLAHSGDPMVPQLQNVLIRAGYKPDPLGSQNVTGDMLNEAELVLCFSRNQLDFLRGNIPEAPEKIFTLHEYTGTRGEIKDPDRQIGYHPFIDLFPWPIPKLLGRVHNDNVHNIDRLFEGLVKRVEKLVDLSLQRMVRDGFVR